LDFVNIFLKVSSSFKKILIFSTFS